MILRRTFLLALLFLAACGNRTAVKVPVPALEIPAKNPAAPLSPEAALQHSFASRKLGMSFRYPAFYYDAGCNALIPVIGDLREGGVDFYLSPTFNQAKCPSVAGNNGLKVVFTGVYSMPVKDEGDLRIFLQKVSSKDCVIDTQVQEGDATVVTAKLKNASKNVQNNRCVEIILWNKKLGIAVSSPLRNRTGVGGRWPAAVKIRMPDGTIEQSYDNAIMQSLRFVKLQ